MSNELLIIRPEELKFVFEQNKQSSCELHLSNNTETYVAFKVKTTSPKKYFVRPNTGVLLPQASCDITLTMQAQHEAPPYMQCKDKFLVLGVVVPFGTEQKDITADVFNKDSGKNVEECKLRVVYVSPPKSSKSLTGDTSPRAISRAISSDNGNQDGPTPDKDIAPIESSNYTRSDFDDSKARLIERELDLSKLRQEREVAIQQCQHLQQELAAALKKKGSNKAPVAGFSFLFVILVGLLGILIGYHAHS